jgi:hypothetical protein
MLPSLRPLALSFTASITLLACAGGNAASRLATAPEYAPKDQTKCSIEKSKAKPLIVEWPSAEDAESTGPAHDQRVNREPANVISLKT